MSKTKPKMLVIAKTLPLFDRASGDYRLFQILDILKEDFSIDYLNTQHAALHKVDRRLDYLVRDGNFQKDKFEMLDAGYQEALRNIGVTPLGDANPIPFTVRPTDDFDIRPYLARKKYDVVWVEFFYVADLYLQEIRRFQPWAIVICDSVDLHFRRLARQAEYLENKVEYTINFEHEKLPPDSQHFQKVKDHRHYADHVREQEINAYERCDAVVVVSEDDKVELKKMCPRLPLLFVPNIHPLVKQKESVSFSKRSGCVFVGNFDHHPNVTAALYLKHEVAPRLTDHAIHFQIVGSNPPRYVRTITEFGIEKERFTVTGFVPSTEPYLDQARVSVAPILFGAGMNGKIGEAIGAGLPVVTTSLGALGMELVHGETCLIADTAEDFARAIERLHSDEKLWHKIRKQSLNHLKVFLDRDHIEKGVRRELSEFLRTRPKKECFDLQAPKLPKPVSLPKPKISISKKRPLFSVIVLAYNQWKYTEFCLRTLAHAQKQYPDISSEIILVDNASTDETRKRAEKIPGLRAIWNSENFGFARGNNIGIEEARGENVVVLNNDTLVPPHWLAGFAHHLRNVPDIGLLGPCSNTETGQSLSIARYGALGEYFSFNKDLVGKNSGSWEPVKKISGLCMVIPRRTIETVGVFDPGYGIGYFEDDDLCLRVADKGLRLVLARDVYVHHFGSISFDASSVKRIQYLEEGMSHFAFKWGKRGLEHIAKAHKETLLRIRKPKTFEL